MSFRQFCGVLAPVARACICSRSKASSPPKERMCKVTARIIREKILPNAQMLERAPPLDCVDTHPAVLAVLQCHATGLDALFRFFADPASPGRQRRARLTPARERRIAARQAGMRRDHVVALGFHAYLQMLHDCGISSAVLPHRITALVFVSCMPGLLGAAVKDSDNEPALTKAAFLQALMRLAYHTWISEATVQREGQIAAAAAVARLPSVGSIADGRLVSIESSGDHAIALRDGDDAGLHVARALYAMFARMYAQISAYETQINANKTLLKDPLKSLRRAATPFCSEHSSMHSHHARIKAAGLESARVRSRGRVDKSVWLQRVMMPWFEQND